MLKGNLLTRYDNREVIDTIMHVNRSPYLFMESDLINTDSDFGNHISTEEELLATG